MPDTAQTGTTVGDLISAFLEANGATTAFGVISIHNMPILDAFARRGAVRFVPARGEAGALNMADAHARISGKLGVGVTSTGVAAGNAAGSLLEALTASTPLIHLTGQIDSGYVDRNMGFIHEVPHQPDMLRAVSKAFFRISSADEALETLVEAARIALTPPFGPVSLETPVDIQAAPAVLPAEMPVVAVDPMQPEPAALDRAADMLAAARRPMLWLGGGARNARDAALELASMGVGIVSSVHGRGILPDNHPMSFGAFNSQPPVEEFYKSCDLLLVAGSRLRGNETFRYTLKLPTPIVQIDIDPAMEGRTYPADHFVAGDATLALEGIAERVRGRLDPDPRLIDDLRAARAATVELGETNVAPYRPLIEGLLRHFPFETVWVRDLTLSNSIWGNRIPAMNLPRQSVHPLGGAIGQGVPMAAGAALAAAAEADPRKTVLLTGDGGLFVCAGELATLRQENADVTIILMNDGGYGVIRNIQAAHYGSRHHYVDLHMPDFAAFLGALGIPHRRVDDTAAFGDAFAEMLAVEGPSVVEVDMTVIGPYEKRFAGPPVR